MSPHLFDDVRHGVAFVEKPQFAVSSGRIGRVHEDSPVTNGAVNVRHH